MTASRVARPLWLLVVLSTLGATALLSWSHDSLPVREALVAAAGAVLAVVASTVGVALAAVRPRHPITVLLLGFGATFGARALLAAYAVAGTVGGHHLPGAVAAGWLQAWLGLLCYPAGITGLLLFFPTGRLEGRIARTAAVVGVVGGVLVVLERVLEPDPLVVGLQLTLGHDNPTGVDAGWVSALSLGWPLSLVALLLAVVDLVRRARVAPAPQQRSLRLLTATGVLIGVTAVLAVPVAVSDNSLHGLAASLIAVAATVEVGVILPLVLAAAVLDRELFGLERVLDRGLTWIGLVAVITTGYVGAVLYLTTLVGRHHDEALRLVATLVVALAFHPVRLMTQRAVGRLVYGPDGDPRRLALALVESPAPNTTALADAVRRAVGADSVRLELAGRAAFSGRTDLPLEVRALERAGEPLGSLAIDHASLAHLPRSRRRLLDHLTEELARAAHDLAQRERLERAQAALLAAAADERTRLRHDLHDGVGPSLSGLRMKVAAARRRLPDEPDHAAEVLDDVARDLVHVTGELRQVLDRMSPGPWDGRPLDVVLLETATALGLSATVEVDPDVSALPPEHTTAVLRILQEAVHNVAQHAGCRSCSVRVALTGSTLDASVEDDGVGFDGAARPGGVGLTSMRQRAALLGGALAFSPRPGGGTSVRLALPLDGQMRGA